MIQVGYYPGCALHGTAAEYDETLRAVCQALDIHLAELEDWNCCGASSAHCLDDRLAVELAERNLRLAEQTGPELLVPCAACFQRLKYAQKHGPTSRLGGARADAGNGHSGSATGRGDSQAPDAHRATEAVAVWHVNEFFSRPEWLARLQERMCRPLQGLAGAPYYGCLTQRQPKWTDALQPEWPTSMDCLMEALGMVVCRWSYKTDCCGGSLEVARPDLVQHLCDRLVQAAHEASAECLVTACPMCQANLDISQTQAASAVGKLPVFYITELMALALGVGRPERWQRRHMIDPRPLLEQKGLWQA